MRVSSRVHNSAGRIRSHCVPTTIVTVSRSRPAHRIRFEREAQANEADIRELMRLTDRVAEIQDTLRVETPVTLSHVEVVAM